MQADCAIDLDTNGYSIPWRLIGETMQVVVCAGRVVIRHAGAVGADHPLCEGRRQRVIDRSHLLGDVGAAHARRRDGAQTPVRVRSGRRRTLVVAPMDHDQLIAMLDRFNAAIVEYKS